MLWRQARAAPAEHSVVLRWLEQNLSSIFRSGPDSNGTHRAFCGSGADSSGTVRVFSGIGAGSKRLFPGWARAAVPSASGHVEQPSRAALRLQSGSSSYRTSFRLNRARGANFEILVRPSGLERPISLLLLCTPGGVGGAATQLRFSIGHSQPLAEQRHAPTKSAAEGGEGHPPR